MFKKVSKTFFRFIAGYIVLILAFSFSFYILFKENTHGGDVVLFNNPFISVVKTIVMFSGEFEASDLPFDTLPGTSHVIFLLFVFLVAIALLNLLNGLAVGDTEDVRKRAETLSFVARIRLIKYIFEVYFALPYIMTLYPVVADKTFVLYPNKKNNIGSTELESLQRIINEKRERNKKEKTIEHVKDWTLFSEKLSTLQLESAEMRQKLSTLQLQSEEMRQILKKIMTHFNISES